MAWTVPMTFIDGAPLTAAQLNTHLRDNLLETMTGKATVAGRHFAAAGVNTIAERAVASARVATQQTTDSVGDWIDLETPGPSVTVTTGTTAAVMMYAKMANLTAGSAASMSWEISGATTRSPRWDTSVESDGLAVRSVRYGGYDVITTLTPGANTFTTKYRVASGTGQWADRFICVIPM